MKALILILLLHACYIVALCQPAKTSLKKYPFDIEVLQSLADKKDTIMPTYNNGKFQYVNIKTGRRIMKETFEVAYPFDGRNAAIIKSGNKYGVVDRAGKILVEPKYLSFQLWNSPFRENLVSFDNRSDNCFDLQKNIFVTPGNGCEKPLFDMPCCVAFKDGNKYGINLMEKGNYYNQRTLIAPVFDSVYIITSSMAIGRKGSKIILVDTSGMPSYLGEYEDVLLSRPMTAFNIPWVIGLKKGSGWEYYILAMKPQLLFTSPFRCYSIGELSIKDAFGIYREKDKYRILSVDNKTLEHSYDWISQNGTVALDGSSVYIIGEDGIPFLYFNE